jgi:hypothetical protein
MCCKVVGIIELAKPQSVWCSHCAPGKGCKIYETRPAECRQFYCGWIQDTTMSEDWRPDRAKFVVSREASGRIVIHCDAAAPVAWRREPYYANVKSWVRRQGSVRQEVIVMTGRKVTLLAPEGEFDLGERNTGDQLTMSYDHNNRLVKAALVPGQVSVAEAPGAKATS